MTIFEKIIARQIPATFHHEDEQCIAIADISPRAPVHLLVIPKRVITRISEAAESDEPLIGHLLTVAGALGKRLCPSGFRVVINNGSDGGETVPHLHVHVLGKRSLAWPPG